MNRQRLMFILGGAAMGALLGSVYANYLYTQQRHKADLSVYNSEETATEPSPTAKKKEDSST